jgi:hypothetical protein
MVAVYDNLVRYHADDLRQMVAMLTSYISAMHVKVLLENVFNPVNKIWGFSAIATLYSMYIYMTEGR